MRQANREILIAKAALREKQDAMRAAGEATKQAATAEAALTAQLERITTQQREVATTAAALGRAQAAGAAQAVQAHAGVRESLEGIGAQLRTVQTLAGAAIGGQLLGGLAGDVARTADQYNNLAARMRLVVGEGAAFDQAFEGVFDVASRTGTAVEETGTLFTRLAQAGKDAGLSSQQAAQQALGLTEAINQATQLSGASAESSSAAIQQLIQGLQSGVLRGEEFNSVMEQAPRLARALADGLGVTTGELRKLAEAGQLSSATVITALQGQSATLQAEFDKLPPTVGRALRNLSTEWTRYVGEVDKATGASATAASAITALARNLDTVGALLFSAGKAVAAYQALKLAQTFLGIADAAKVSAATVAAETAATVANTTAKAANRAETLATGAALETAAAGAGRFAALLGTLKLFSLVGILTNVRELGTALGEGVAKLVGYGDATKRLEAADKAAAEAARENAQAAAQLAQQHQLAADKALGLTAQSKALVAEFEQARTKGDSAAEAVGKLGKALDLGDLQGIRNAGAALDALALKGSITASQVRDALGKALNGADLAVFEATARAAFDTSEQGARRLAAALDAVGNEALRRVGTSVAELKTGFSETATSAINDLDAVARKVDELGIKGTGAGNVLAAALDKALTPANTVQAVQAVIARWEELGRQGLVTGDQLAAGLEKARAKIDSLTPGVVGLGEALRTFGLKSRDELARTAETFRTAWSEIANSTTVSLNDKARAFVQYRDAAIAANGGIVPSEVRVQEEMLRTRIAAEGTGGAIATAMLDAGKRVDDLRGKVGALAEQLNAAATTIDGTRSRIADTTTTTPQPVATDDGVFQSLKAKQQAGTLSASDLAAAKALADASRANASTAFNNQSAFGIDTTNFYGNRDTQAQEILAEVERLVRQGSAAPGAKAAPAGVTVNVNLDSRKLGSVTVGSKSEADALAGMLKELAQARAVSQ